MRPVPLPIFTLAVVPALHQPDNIVQQHVINVVNSSSPTDNFEDLYMDVDPPSSSDSLDNAVNPQPAALDFVQIVDAPPDVQADPVELVNLYAPHATKIHRQDWENGSIQLTATCTLASHKQKFLMNPTPTRRQ